MKRVLSFAIVPLLGACTIPSVSDAGFGRSRDLTPEKVVLYEEAETGGLYPLEEVRTGEGRAAQPDRRLTVLVEFGSRPASRVTFLYPTPTGHPFDYPPYRWVGHRPFMPGSVPREFWTGLAGMREGGRRRFTIPRSSCGNSALAECALVDGETGARVAYPNGVPVETTVTLLKVCAPRLLVVSRTFYTIPAMTETSYEVKELECR